MGAHIEIVLPGEPDAVQRARAGARFPMRIESAGDGSSARQKASADSYPNPTLAVTDGRVTVFHPWTIGQIVASTKRNSDVKFTPGLNG